MLRVGFFEYINALPLIGNLLENVPSDIEIVLDTPAQLSNMLKENQLDLSMISTSEYLANKEKYHLIPEYGIAANGPVKSVHLYTKLPLNYVDTIYVSNHSKTSYHLCRVLCMLHWDVEPKFQLLEHFEDLVSKDAFLLIGDMALMVPYFEGYHTIDLSQQWHEMTRSPFVFGVIAYNQQVDISKVQQFMKNLTASFEWGKQNRAQIINMARSRLPIQEHHIDSYYKHIYHRLSEKELEAIDLFDELLQKINQTLPV